MWKAVKDRSLQLLNNISMRNKILVFLFLMVAIFVAVLSISTFNRVSVILNEESCSMMLNTLNQTNTVIDNNIHTAEVALNSFYSGGEIRSLISQNSQISKNHAAYFRSIKQQIFLFKNSNDSVTDLRIFSFDKNIPKDNVSLFDVAELAGYSWEKDLLQAGEQADAFYWTNAGDSTWNKFSYIPSIYCYKPVFADADGRPEAILRMDVSASDIFGVIDLIKFGQSGSIFVAKSNGNLVYYSEKNTDDLGDFKEKIAKIVQKGGKQGSLLVRVNKVDQLLVFNRNNTLGWYVIGDIPEAEVTQQASLIRNFILVVSLVILAIALVLAFWVANILSKRLIHLSKQISQFGKGNAPIVIDTTGNDEIGQLAFNLRLMLTQISRLLTQVREDYDKEITLQEEKHELEILKKDAELSALQAEINPHFLYNTLEMIKGLVFAKDSRTSIVHVTQALADMFRYNLSAGYIVTMQDEIAHIQNYLVIQNYRFEQTVILVNQLDSAALRNRIVRVTLEPIVENSIKYGFRKHDSEYRIRLTAEHRDDMLIISVADDGVGIEPEKLLQMQQSLYVDNYEHFAKRKEGIGIHNVNVRIKKHFGTQYGLQIDSIRDKGTTVRILLPLDEPEN